MAKTEGMLFKYGSGTGTNLSTLRSSKESLAKGGISSGPVSFMKGFDAFAGVIKSGGTTRRAAKMVMLNADHPDIEEFVECKAKEEKKAHVLIRAGYDQSIDGEAYSSIFFQNANNSVRVTDAFMKAVETDDNWSLNAVTTGESLETIRAKYLMQAIARATWECGDPGMQFDTTINKWHTSPVSGRINGSNPCSEYMYLDDTACNLASINLLKFLLDDGTFNVEGFTEAVKLSILSQEILVSLSSYPTPKIAQNSEDFRPLGLGFANLGALLMAMGYPYDSNEGRSVAGLITAIMHGAANLESSRLASLKGPFNGYEENKKAMLHVMRKHREEANGLAKRLVDFNLNLQRTRGKTGTILSMMKAMTRVWAEVIEEGERYGFRNAQVTVLAPTGTIAFMMDCATTGIEPDIALVKYKSMVGGGNLKLVNQTVPRALKNLGYSADDIASILSYIEANDTVEGKNALVEEHLPVFDCAFTAKNGTRSISWEGHLKMMAACQPFLSGAISKTVNLPNEATVDDVEKAYMLAWKLGVKAVAIYRDGCKQSQPLSTSKTETPKVEAVELPVVFTPVTKLSPRTKLPDERHSLTHKFSIGGAEGYLTVGMYEDGTPGELFITIAKEGSTLSGLMDAFATSISMALQYGVPLNVLCDKFTNTRFEPNGFTGHPDIHFAKSIIDYIFQWLDLKFIPKEKKPVEPAQQEYIGKVTVKRVFDGPTCGACGNQMTPSGACFRCECGSTSGCS